MTVRAWRTRPKVLGALRHELMTGPSSQHMIERVWQGSNPTTTSGRVLSGRTSTTRWSSSCRVTAPWDSPCPPQIAMDTTRDASRSLSRTRPRLRYHCPLRWRAPAATLARSQRTVNAMTVDLAQSTTPATPTAPTAQDRSHTQPHPCQPLSCLLHPYQMPRPRLLQRHSRPCRLCHPTHPLRLLRRSRHHLRHLLRHPCHPHRRRLRHPIRLRHPALLRRQAPCRRRAGAWCQTPCHARLPQRQSVPVRTSPASLICDAAMAITTRIKAWGAMRAVSASSVVSAASIHTFHAHRHHLLAPRLRAPAATLARSQRTVNAMTVDLAQSTTPATPTAPTAARGLAPRAPWGIYTNATSPRAAQMCVTSVFASTSGGLSAAGIARQSIGTAGASGSSRHRRRRRYRHARRRCQRHRRRRCIPPRPRHHRRRHHHRRHHHCCRPFHLHHRQPWRPRAKDG